MEMPALETERRKNHIDLIDPNHVLLPIAMDCLKYQERESPSSEELCQRLAGLKDSHHYRDSVRQHQVEIQAKDDQIISQSQQLLERDRVNQDNERVIRQLNQQLEKQEKVIKEIQQTKHYLQRQLQMEQRLRSQLSQAPIKEEGAVNVVHPHCHLLTSFIPTVEEKPHAPVPVKTEVKEESVTVTKDDTTSAQPTGMSSHFITSIVR